MVEQGALRAHIPWSVPTGGFQTWLEIGQDFRVLRWLALWPSPSGL